MLDARTGSDFFDRLFAWLKIDPDPARYEADDSKNVLWRHFVANNGLSDVWVVYNMRKDREAEGTLVLDEGLRPAWRIDLRTGERTPMTDGRLPVHLPALESVVYVTPRSAIADAPADWLGLQREWWKGTGDLGAPFPKPEMKLAVDLTDGWLLRETDPNLADASGLTGLQADEKGWLPTRLGVVSLPDHPEMRRAVLRRHFHVPDAWAGGRVLLRLPEFRQRSSVFLDGALLVPNAAPPTLKAGSDHVMAVDVQAPGAYLGTKGNAWITYHPTPVARQEIGGDWQASPDFLEWKGTAALPGPLAEGIRALRRTVKVDPAAVGKTIVLHAMQDGRLIDGAIVNGSYVRSPVSEAAEFNLNVTPWLKPGEENEIVLLDRSSKGNVSDLALEFHVPGTYP
jgi:hypothetical protein